MAFDFIGRYAPAASPATRPAPVPIDRPAPAADDCRPWGSVGGTETTVAPAVRPTLPAVARDVGPLHRIPAQDLIKLAHVDLVLRQELVADRLAELLVAGFPDHTPEIQGLWAELRWFVRNRPAVVAEILRQRPLAPVHEFSGEVEFL